MQSSLSLAWYKHEAPGNVPVPGLPDGIFAYQTYQFGYILDGFGMENIAKFACYLVYFMTNWYFYYYLVFWVHCYSFGKLYQDKSGSPDLRDELVQGCQMVCFQTKNPNLEKIWRVLQRKMLVYFMDTSSILRSFVIFYLHLV
jgi:hypothetical protein